MPPYCDEHQMYYRMAFVDGFPYQQCVCVMCESGRLSGFDSPQGTGTTEQPSVAAADKGLILTEEELRFRESVFQDQYMGSVMSKKPYQYSQEIIASHRSLLSANAELSFKNMKLKDSLSKVKDHLEGVMNPKRFVILDGPGMLQTLNQALEELK